MVTNISEPGRIGYRRLHRNGVGQGEFYNDYLCCLIANKNNTGWAFYRYHIPDPIFFKKDLRVTLQQKGGNRKVSVVALQKRGAPMLPVGIDDRKKVLPLYEKDKVAKLDTPGLPDGFSNFSRSDDVSATAYFYLDKPTSPLPDQQPLAIRLFKVKKQ
jgi:hypothetical protein